MKFFSFAAVAFGAYSAMAQPLQARSSSARDILGTLQSLQRNIHEQVVAIDTALSEAESEAADADQTQHKEAITTAFENMINSVNEATESHGTIKVSSRDLEERKLDFTPTIIKIYAVIQAITNDFTSVIGRAIDFFNHSEQINDLATLFTTALLKFIDAILKPLLNLPFADHLRELINKILGLIPV
ncbi:hypothetical protein K4F52_000576 [Lecanicillium sp. MT-2017a]|nr:hypothetical protein K4F52_000576 [Lecanicillium sp. MT-2017a]